VIKSIAPSIGEGDLETVYQKVYTSFVEALDGIDNGISAYPGDLTPLYKSRTDLSSRVGKLNPEWNEEGSVDIAQRFAQAMELTGREFAQEVNFYAKSWLPARHIVKEALAKRFDVHPSGQILRLDTFTLWKNHLLDIEVEDNVPNLILYVLYAEAGSNKWSGEAGTMTAYIQMPIVHALNCSLMLTPVAPLLLFSSSCLQARAVRPGE
jgi:uncharacterized UPF0160 family protein